MKTYNELISNRRTIYALGRNIKISDDELVAFVKSAVKHTPTAFNSQTGMAVVLLHEKHEELWELVKTSLKAVVPAESFAETEAKINSFKAAYGTVLVYENSNTVKALQEKFPLFAANFPKWSDEASGMLQYILWAGFSDLGLGVNIQHYTELIEEQLRELLGIEPGYVLHTQMLFGSVEAPAGTKAFNDIDERVKVFK